LILRHTPSLWLASSLAHQFSYLLATLLANPFSSLRAKDEDANK